VTERVAILGASDNPARYAFRALDLLTRHGHDVVLVNPQLTSVAGRPCVARLEDIDGAIDTITVYLRNELSEPLADAMLAAKPRPLIFNPGTESPVLKRTLEAARIRVQWECTLVLLNSGRFEA
jgi:predicted CoA-binding protein